MRCLSYRTILVFSVALHSAACGGQVAGGPSDENPDATAIDAGVPFPVLHAAGGDSSAPVPTCQSVNDCTDPSLGLEPPVCCIANACVENPPTADCDSDTSQIIRASNYDQTCQSDSDCVWVAEGNGCYPGAFTCTNAVISRTAYPQYESDVARTRAASCWGGPQNCGASGERCCVRGVCQINDACPTELPPPPIADAGLDVGSIDGGPADAGFEDVELPACYWPPPDLYEAGPASCTLSRALNDCGGTLCLSFEPTTCDGVTVDAGRSCVDRCGPNEYGMTCDFVPTDDGGYQVTPSPTDMCRAVTASDAQGTKYYCCPCISLPMR